MHLTLICVFFHTQQIYFRLYVATRCSITTKTASTRFYMRVTQEYVHHAASVKNVKQIAEIRANHARL